MPLHPIQEILQVFEPQRAHQPFISFHPAHVSYLMTNSILISGLSMALVIRLNCCASKAEFEPSSWFTTTGPRAGRLDTGAGA